MSLDKYISAANGDFPVDLVLKNCNLVNVFSSEVFKTNVAVFGGKVVGFGDYKANEVQDLEGQFLAPGLIDGHVHIESSMLSPMEFARAVVPMGTTAVVADPHEIVNVMGTEGFHFMLESADNVPMDLFFMIPSCVPATHLETSGAKISAVDMKRWIDHPRVLGVAEMMNFPGVIFRDPNVLAKLNIAKNKRIDGHAPLLEGKSLSAYITAGISSDHESSESEEALEKLRKGMFLMIREGSAARNLKALIPIVNEKNSRFCSFVTDDRHPDFLMDFGHINSMVRDSIELGIDPIVAIQMGTINTATHFSINGRGAIAPGYIADMIVFDNFQDFNINRVYRSGVLVAENGHLIKDYKTQIDITKNSVNIRQLSYDQIEVRAEGKLMRVIEIIPDQIITKQVLCQVSSDGEVVGSNTDNDILKIVVVERHRGTGNIGVGFVKGFGLQSGAVASTVAHDSHNVISIGVSDADILKAIEAVEKMAGGQVVVSEGNVLSSLPLPIAGLMSNRPLEDVRGAIDQLNRAANKLGCPLDNPFMTLSFLALPVIPELKLTDKGLVDVGKFDFVSLFT